MRSKIALSICFLITIATSLSSAADKKVVAFEFSAGSPQTLSLQIAYVGIESFAVGLGFGTLPVNEFLQSQVPTDPVALNLGLPVPYSLVPTSQFAFSNISLFARYHFSGNAASGFLLEFNFSRWVFGADLNGALRNDNTGQETSGAMTGRLDMGQPVLTGLAGYRAAVSSSLGLMLTAGVSYLLEPTYSTSVSGSLTSILPLAGPAAQADFEQAKQDIDAQVRNGVEAVRNVTTLLPAIALTVQYAF